MMNSANSAAIKDLLAEARLPSDTPCVERTLGVDEDMIELILAVIASGEKSMTFSLPWLQNVPQPLPLDVGTCLVTLGFDGKPRSLMEVTEVRSLTFGEVDAQVLAREGIPMRDPVAWAQLHEMVWNAVLQPLGRTVGSSMPVWAEYFTLRAGS